MWCLIRFENIDNSLCLDLKLVNLKSYDHEYQGNIYIAAKELRKYFLYRLETKYIEFKKCMLHVKLTV